MTISQVRSRALSGVLTILVTLVLASSASAQGLFSLPSLGGWFGTQQCGPSVCDPCAPCPHLDVFVGWQGGQKQTLSAHTDQATPGALFREIKFDTPNEGIWLGVAATADVSCKFGVSLMGWYFFSSNKSGSYLVDPSTALPNGYGNLPAKVDWWYVDLMGKYRHWQNMSLLFGARFDHHNVSSNDSDFGFVYPTPNPYRLDLNAFTTSLFLGMEYASDCGLTLRAIYAPFSWTSGKTKFGQSYLLIPTAGPNEVDTSKAVNPLYLAELFIEYTRPVSTGMKLGGFARGTWLHAAGNSTLSESIVSGSASYDFSYDRTSWTIGGKAELAFNTSGLWY
jgi:hypothetical protein